MKDTGLWAIVMIRFPKLEKERTCRMERTMRNAARESYYKRLLSEQQAKVTVLANVGEAAADSRKEV